MMLWLAQKLQAFVGWIVSREERKKRAAYRRLFADRAVRIHDDQEITYSRKKRAF